MKARPEKAQKYETTNHLKHAWYPFDPFFEAKE